ncbi:MAG TPA: anti-sigma factor antagonist [Candidatus Krumholzibacteria bacterium]|nr:anti-sigma factor antagonist [Candidatus Krumholzibacteria bacterium]
MARPALVERNERRELTVLAQEGQLGRVRDFVVAVCEDAGFSPREIANTKLAVDEACTNIIKHAYEGKTETGDIGVVADIEAGRVRIHLRDRGKHFDFASVKDPDLDQYVETGKKGGLGVFLINRLMDGVEYRTTEVGNELVLTKRSQAAFSAAVLPEKMPLRGTLRFKFMVRASGGLAALMLVAWAFIMVRQTSDIDGQRTTQWMEKRRLAESIASRSVSTLVDPSEFSIDQTNLTSELAKLVGAGDEIAYARVVDAMGNVRASGRVEEVFQPDPGPAGEIISEDGAVTWSRHDSEQGEIRDIAVRVAVPGADGQRFDVGVMHLGVYKDAVEGAIEDTRLSTTLLLLGIFAVGILLIMGLVQVFVRPIQLLTDGVRAIGDGNMDSKLDVRGPAEIGAIAGVFNEITEKFKKARDSILEQEKMQKEIEVAKQIQQSLLPRRRPEISGYDIAPLYQAAAEVGGDYYDFVQVDDDTIGVVVADVSGKGVPGSLVMTMIRTALRMEARGNRNASDVMSKMNTFVTDDMKKGMFVTMFYVILDSKNRVISYASAGHNPMILYRHETRETFFLNPRGFPVGISLPDETLFRRSISLEKVRLKKDDMLVIYTDGVTEAMNEKREQYGEERLIQIVKTHGHLSPDDFISRLDAELKGFTAGHPQSDDITVVAIKERMTADDILFGIRRKLIDLVDVQGMNVKDACRQMKVSPATYYRYKKRLEVMGERGLRNDILRDDVSIKRVSLEARKEIVRIIAADPDLGAKRITEEYNKGRDASLHVTERMVYEELKRLNMNTRELRLDYLRRHGLVRDADGALPAAKETRGQPAARDLVDDLLREIPGVLPPASVPDASAAGAGAEPPPVQYQVEGVGVSVSTSDGITDVRLSGHVDSASSAGLERRLRDLTAAGAAKIVVDLTDVSYVSSGGWGIFVGEVGGLRKRGGDIVLSGMTPEVFDVYELLGFADVLRSFGTVTEARAWLSLPPDARGAAVVARPATPEHDLRAGVDFEDGAMEPVDSEAAREWQSLRIEATTVGEKGDVAVLALAGIIDTVSAERLREALHQVIAGGRMKIVADMSHVEYVSSGGWGVFTERLREVRRAGGDIKLFGMDPDVYYVFTMLGFNIVLSSFDLFADAIDDFRRTAPGMEAPSAEPTKPARLDEPTEAVRSVWSLAATPGLDLSWEDGPDGIRIARLAGVIETTAVSLIADELGRELERAPRAFVFDLAKVEYISSSGWGQFARAFEATRSVALVGMGPDLLEVYDCLEFRNFIPAYATQTEALRTLAGGGPEPTTAPSSEMPGVSEPRPSKRAAGKAVAPTHDDGLDDVLGSPSPPRVDDAGGREVPKGFDAIAPDETPLPRGSEWKDAGTSPDVSIDSAVSDRNKDRDKKLRSLGWQRYGERLRRGDDTADPGAGRKPDDGSDDEH